MANSLKDFVTYLTTYEPKSSEDKDKLKPNVANIYRLRIKHLIEEYGGLVNLIKAIDVITPLYTAEGIYREANDKSSGEIHAALDRLRKYIDDLGNQAF